MKKILFLLLFLINAPIYAAVSLIPQLQKPFNDNKLHIYLCGTGTPNVEAQSYRKPACVAVLLNQHFFLVDAGEGAIQTLGGLRLPVEYLNTAFITHWHSDHFGGLGPAINTTWIAGRTSPFTVYGPFGIHKVLRGLKEAYALDVLYRTINARGNSNPVLASAKGKQILATPIAHTVMTTVDGLTVQAFAVNHFPVVPALGYRIQYKNCTAVISGDTTTPSNVGQNSKNADVLIHEAYSHYLKTIGIIPFAQHIQGKPSITLSQQKILERYHSDSDAVAKEAAHSRVKHLVLTHLGPPIPTSKSARDEFKKGMDAFYKGPIIVANDKDQIILTPTDTGCRMVYERYDNHSHTP